MAEQFPTGAFDPRENEFRYNPAPDNPLLRSRTGWENFVDGWMMNPSIQAAIRWSQPTQAEPGFSIYDHLRGRENNIEAYRNVVSSAQLAAVDAQIAENEQRRRNLEDAGFFSQLFAAGADPINLAIPFPAVRGLGFVRGALMGGVASGVTQLGMEALASNVDPTWRMDQAQASVLYATVFGGLLGGGMGMLGARGARGIADDFIREQQAGDRAVKGVSLEEPPRYVTLDQLTPEQRAAAARVLDEGGEMELNGARVVRSADEIPVGERAPAEAAGGRAAASAAEPPVSPLAPAPRADGELPFANFSWWGARPTGPEGSGIAKAFGIEKVVGVMSPMGRSIASGYRAIGELAQALGGDFSMKTVLNQVGVEAPPSALLLSTRWKAMAQDFTLDLNKLFVYGRGGDEGVVVGKMNLSAGVMKVKDGVMDRFSRGPDALTAQEFRAAVFEARATGEAPTAFAGKQLDGRMQDAVNKGAERVAKFFETARAEGVESGWIRTAEWKRRHAIESAKRLVPAKERFDELFTKPDKTHKEMFELQQLQAQISRAESRLLGMELDDVLNMDDVLRGRIGDLLASAEKRAAGAKDLADKIRHEVAGRFEAFKAAYDDLGRRPVEQMTPKQKAYYEKLKEMFGTRDEPGPLAAALDDYWLAMGYRRQDRDILAALGADPANSPLVWHGSKAEFDRMSLDAVGSGVGRQAFGHGIYVSDDMSVGFRYANGRGDSLGHIYEAKVDVDLNTLLHWDLPLNQQPASVQAAVKRITPNVDLKVTGGQWHDSLRTADGARDPKGVRALLLENGIPGVKYEAYETAAAVERGALNYVIFDDRAIRIMERDGQPVRVGQPEWTMPARDLDNASPKQRELLADLDRQAQAVALSDAQRVVVQDLMNRLYRGEIKFEGPPFEKNYLPRHWDMEALLADPDGARAAIAKGLDFVDRQQGYKADAGELAERAKRVYDGLLKHDGIVDEWTDFGPQSLLHVNYVRARQLEFPNKFVLPYIVKDIEEVVTQYARSAGPGIEYARMFDGDPRAVEAIEEAITQASRESKATTYGALRKEMDTLRADLHDLRASAQARMREGKPLSLDRLSAETIKNAVNYSSMGAVVKSAIVEFARPFMVNGVANVFGASLEALQHLSAVKAQADKMGSLISEGMDVLAGGNALRMVDMMSTNMGERPATAFVRMLDQKTRPFNEFQHAFFNMTGLPQVTDMLKRWQMTMSTHFFLEDVRRYAAGTLSKRALENLRAYGLNEADLAAIAAQPWERTKGGLNLANITQWSDGNTAAKFYSAVAGEVRRSIVTPSAGDKSLLQQGFVRLGGQRREFAMTTLPFQFMSYGISATSKVLLSAAQGRDASPIVGLGWVVAFGYFSSWLKTSEFAWDKMSTEEKLLMAVENSGVLATFGDINQQIEVATMHQAGLRPWLGMNPRNLRNPQGDEPFTTPFGAAGAKAHDLWQAAFDPYWTQDERASAVRRALPLNNVLYLNGAFKAGQGYAQDAYNAALGY